MSDSLTVPSFPAIPQDAGRDFKGSVAIIGAGVAGLFAANTLNFLGVEDYIILEAGETFGGRLKSAVGFHNEVPLELGAEWIHASSGKIVKDMLVFPPAEGLGPEEFIKYQPAWHFRSKRNRVLGCIYQETKWKRTSYKCWIDEYVYQHVKEKVHFNTAVMEVHYAEDGGQVKLMLADGTVHRADRVICTVPLPVLQQDGAIRFYPPLPQQKREAIQAVGVLSGLRVLFEMKEKFYPDLTSAGYLWDLVKDHDQMCFAYDALYGKELPGKQNVLAFVAVGDKHCSDLVHLDDESLAKAVLSKIDNIFNGQGTKNYIKHEVQKPWSCCCCLTLLCCCRGLCSCLSTRIATLPPLLAACEYAQEQSASA